MSPFDGENVLQFGSLQVQLVEEAAYSTVRTMTLKMEGEESRSVRQFHYLWPTHGVLSAPLHLLEFIQDIKKSYQLKEDGPLIVHCRYAAYFKFTRIL